MALMASNNALQTRYRKHQKSDLFLAGNFASANRPDRLIRHHNLGPVLHLAGHRLDLLGDDVKGLVGLPLLQGLSHTQDDLQPLAQGVLCLLSHKLHATSM